MKCDVCGTKIPVGSRECPQCGYKYGTSHVNTYDATGHDHEHIQIKPKKVNYRPKQSNQYRSHTTQKSGQVLKIVLIVFIIATFLGALIPAVIGMWTSFKDVFEQNELEDEITIQEAIDEGYDDGTLTLALDEEEELLVFADEVLHFSDISVNEYISTSYGVYVSFSIDGYIDEGHYSIDVSLSDAELRTVTLTLYNDSLESIRTSNAIEREKYVIDELGLHYGNDNLFERVFNASHQLVNDADEDNRWRYNNQDSSLYLSERYDPDSDIYSYYARIDIYGE